MNAGIVTRDENVWQGHPDIAYFDNHIYIVWRESNKHLTDGGTFIKVVRGSVVGHADGSSSVVYLTEPKIIASSPHRLNCPRLSVINGLLYLICDEILSGGNFIQSELQEDNTNVFLWHTEDGENWEGPVHTNIKGIVPDRICQFRGEYLIATHTGASFPDKKWIAQSIWKTSDLDSGEWTRRMIISDPSMNFCEASVTVTPEDKLLCLMRENSQKGLPAYLSITEDVDSWRTPVPTRLFGCHRPVIGFLKSGRLLTTYREASHIFHKKYWARNTFAHLCDFDNPDPLHCDSELDLRRGIILPLDHDNSSHPDSGYTGWVQLEDEKIVVVNYITGNAPYVSTGKPKPYIKWYVLTEEDFCLPE